MVRTQLTHEKVQKSMSTTLPRRSARVSGGVLSHPSMPVKSGAPTRWPTGSTSPPVVDAVAGGVGSRTTVKSTAATISAATVARAARYRVTWARRHCTASLLRNHYDVEEPLRPRSCLLACDAASLRR